MSDAERIKIGGDLLVLGTATFANVNLPDDCVGDDQIEEAADLDASKLEHQFPITYSQADGSDIVAAIVPIYTCRGTTAEVIDVEVVCIDAPEGGDKKFTVDIKKCDQSTPTPATILTAVVDYSSTQADCEVEVATISDADLTDGDTLVVVVAVSGSTGNQGQGLIVNVWIREKAD